MLANAFEMSQSERRGANRFFIASLSNSSDTFVRGVKSGGLERRGFIFDHVNPILYFGYGRIEDWFWDAVARRPLLER